MKRESKSYHIASSDDECLSVTADEVIERDEDTETGLLDQHGKPITRPSQRIKLGFHIP